jgi:predicted PurR-regulated permease PerM
MAASLPPPISSPPWSSRTKRIVVLIGLLLGGILLWRVADVLPILVVSAVLSFLLKPVTDGLERAFGGRRGLAILVTFVLLFVLFIIALLLIFPTLFSELQDFINNLPALIEQVRASLDQTLSQPITIFGQQIVPLDQINQFLGTSQTGETPPNIDVAGTAQAFLASLSGPAFSIVGTAFRTLINLIFLITLMFYMLRDGRRFYNVLVEFASPNYRDDVRRLLYELGEIWNAYLRGQVILCLFIGVVVFIAATILGVRNPLVLGLISGVLEFVPSLGPFLAIIPAVLLALVSPSTTLPFLEGTTFALVVIVVWVIVQNIEAIILVPRIMGGSLNLHPVLIIVGLLAGASFGGALGVILAAPVIASARLLGHYVYGKVTDQQVFPPIPKEAMMPPKPPVLGGLRQRVEKLFGR